MINVTDETFETEVLARSEQVTVVVDLWAEWCGPCRSLGPIIESVVAATDGQVVLTKIDVDSNPRASQVFQVQSIPAVYAVKDRKVIDGFIGALPEAQVQEFVGRLLPSEAETEVERLVALGDETSLRAALEIEADNEAAVIALAELLVSDGRGDDAVSLLARIPETAESRRIAALARTGDAVSDDVDGQLEVLLGQVRDDSDARQKFVDLLEVLGPDDPRTSDWRKKLTLALY